MTEYNINIDSKVINPIYRPYLSDRTRTQIYFGGSSSGKSVALAQKAVLSVLGKRNWLICRAVQKNNRQSTFAEVKKVITAWKLSELFHIHKTDMTITCVNGYQILFAGLDDVEKIKSITPEIGVITDIWVEEATQVDDQAKIKQLEKRLRGRGAESKCLILSFNPILQTHWIAKEYFTRTKMNWTSDKKESAQSIAKEYHDDELLILKTTHWDNHYLTEQDHRLLEEEKDDYFYNVYTLGNWGILGDVIFTNWRVEDLSEMRDQFTNHRNGLDFGFSSDPAALWVSHYDKRHKTIYIYDEFYERGLTNDLLASEILKKIGGDYVRCDSAEPKSIQELCNAGVNAIGARKGKDSVNFGIQWMQQQTIVIDTLCVNAKNEISTYHWKKDKDGNALRIPVDKNNHLIDAGRYAHEDDMIEMTSTALRDPWN